MTRHSLIPNDWTPEQALAVFELFKDITDLIWERYNIHIIDLIAPQDLIDHPDTGADNTQYTRFTTTDTIDKLDGSDPF